jgi:hypothetical protein
MQCNISSLRGSYELPDDGVGTPKHVGAFDWTSQYSGHLMHLLVFYKDIYQNARSNHQDFRKCYGCRESETKANLRYEV